METKFRVLTLHIGNRTISLGVYEDELLMATASMETNHRVTADQYAIVMAQLLQMRDIDPRSLEGAIISSLVPGLTPVLQRAAAQLVQGTVMLVGPGIKTGLDIRLSRVAAVGADFICNCVAALAVAKPPLVVISLESVTTFAAVDENGALVGRSILLGVEQSLQALRDSAAQLPEAAFDPAAPLLGKSTVEAMGSGVLYGAVSMLEGMCSRYRQALGGEVTLIATGESAQAIAGLCDLPLVMRPSLLHDGLHLLYRKNHL